MQDCKLIETSDNLTELGEEFKHKSKKVVEIIKYFADWYGVYLNGKI